MKRDRFRNHRGTGTPLREALSLRAFRRLDHLRGFACMTRLVAEGVDSDHHPGVGRALITETYVALKFLL